MSMRSQGAIQLKEIKMKQEMVVIAFCAISLLSLGFAILAAGGK